MGRFAASRFCDPLWKGALAVVVFCVGTVMVGCSETSFIGRRYDNFTAYYNKFYNAEEAFDEAVESIRERERPIDRSTYLPIFYVPEEGGGQSTFEDVIQKSADILREHPKSKWVDDALLLIGKSYFYQRNYVGASQKFREVIALEGEREGEAHFWLTRTLVATGRLSEAEKAVQAAFSEGPFGSWTARMRLLHGDLLARQEQWAEAAAALQRGLTGDPPDEVAARGAFLLAQVQETLDRPSQARHAYRQVLTYGPRYELDFAARLSAIELQGIHGNADNALDRLEDLEEDDKNYEMRGDMAVVRAAIYRAQGEFDRARRALTSTLYGKEPPSGQSKGDLHYALADLYRDAYDDFTQAAAHFDTASTALGQRNRSSEDVRTVPGAAVDAGAQARQYRRLADRAQRVARLDSLLRVGRMNPDEFDAFVAELRRNRREAQRRKNEAAEAARRSQQFRGGGRRGLPDRRPQNVAADTRSSDAGFLFHKDPARVQEGRRQFEQTWGDRPHVDNWRRRSAIQSQQTASAEPEPAAEEGERAGPSGRTSTAAAQLDLSAIPRDSASQAQMEAERAVARYEFANSLFLAASQPDSAATWYRRILNETPDHPVAQRALYALAEAQRAQGDSAAAAEAYRRLIREYPGSTLAARARERLNRGPRLSGSDEDARADSAYASAYRRWQEEEYDLALEAMLRVADDYRTSDAAPRALLAAGVIYWRMVQHGDGRPPRALLNQYVASMTSSDSAHVDTVSIAANSLENDPVEAQHDSVRTAQMADTSGQRVARDSLATIESDSGSAQTPRLADTAAVSVDSTTVPAPQAAPDSVDQSARLTQTEVFAPLERLLTHLKNQYPSAPQGGRAESMLQLIREKTTAADSSHLDRRARGRTIAADTARTAAKRTRSSPSGRVDSATTDTTAGRRRSEAARPPDRKVLPPPGGPVSAEEETPPAASEPSSTKWTLLVQVLSDSTTAFRRQRELRARIKDWSVDVVATGGERLTRYHLVVGRFDRREAAVRARGELPSELSADAKVRTWPATSARDE